MILRLLTMLLGVVVRAEVARCCGFSGAIEGPVRHLSSALDCIELYRQEAAGE